MTNNFKFSQRSENNLKGVKPQLVGVVRRALELSSMDFSVIEGLRSQERQRELVAAKKSNTMNSKHLTGDAVDLMPVGADWDQQTDWLPVLNAVKQAADEMGTKLRFGYTWTQDPDDKPAPFLDAPHVELAG